MSLKVKFKGEEYWFLGDSFDEDGAIAPLEHCDEKGNIIYIGASFAHYFVDQGIMRYRQKIGVKEDFEVINLV